jgi:hypothetical protein
MGSEAGDSGESRRFNRWNRSQRGEGERSRRAGPLRHTRRAVTSIQRTSARFPSHEVERVEGDGRVCRIYAPATVIFPHEPEQAAG